MSIDAIGRHRLLCGDITTGAVTALMGTDRADVIYSDPPWGPGNLQYWATMHSRGSIPCEHWPAFLTAFCVACATYRAPDAPVFVEMGLRWLVELDATMASVGLERRHRWEILYGPKSKPLPNALTLYGTHDVHVELVERRGEPVTRQILGAVVRPGTVVLDPCTGLGMTARITHALGGNFRGCELNPTRLERTAAWLRTRAAGVHSGQ